MVVPDDLSERSPEELIELVRELRQANEHLRTQGEAHPPAASQLLIDDQLRRTSLLTQLAIEFRETLDPTTIVEQTLRAIVSNLILTGASIILVGPGNQPELALTSVEGAVQHMGDDLAREVIDHGLAGWVVRHGSSVALSDVARDRRWLQFSEQHRSGSVIVIPIRQSSATLGVLTVHRSMAYAFTSHDLILLEGVAAQLGVALSAARHQQSERQRRDQAVALLAMSQFLSAERTPAELATMLHEKSMSVFGARYGLLFLAEPGDEGPRLMPILAEHDRPNGALTTHCGGAARLAWSGQRIVTTAPAGNMTCVALPLTHHGATIGAFALVHHGSGSFSANVWSLLTIFTHVIAAACASMQLVGRLTQQTHLLEELVEQRTQQMQRSRDVLRVVFDGMPDGILLLDSEECVAAANVAFCTQIIGQHPRKVVGQSYTRLWQELERRTRLRVELDTGPQSGPQRLYVQCSGPDSSQRYLVERIPVSTSGTVADQYLEFWRPTPA